MADDDDKTVFGQPLPPRPGAGQSGGAGSGGGQDATPPRQPPRQPPAQSPPVQPRPVPSQPPQDRTVFGQPLPPAGGGPGRVAPMGQPPSWPPPGADDTWLGGALNPAPRPPLQSPPQGAGPGNWAQRSPQPPPQHPRPLYQPGTGARAAGAEIFPEIPQAQQPRNAYVQPRIALTDALKGTGLGAGGSTNPLIAAAANLLILLGRLRTGLVEMQAGPLIDHVTREIDLFERNALAAGVAAMDAQDAKYSLSATADDIVQNLPGADRGVWLEYSMVARFFGERASGVGFFQKMDDAMKAPGQRFHLLELMLTCLSLGFEGQYRTMPNGAVELSRIRIAIYETLRRIQPRPDDDISVRWSAMPMGRRQRRGGVPIWVVSSVAALMVVALFATLSTLLTQKSANVRDGILMLHAGQPPISIERTDPIVQAYVAPESTQLERMRTALADQIAAGRIEVERNNEWVFVRVGDYLRFGSGSAELTSEFADLSTAIGQTLDAESGPVRVVGHTDSVPPSGRGRYKTNEDLSVARAQTVGDILKQSLNDQTRIAVEGKGAVDSIADNTTTEGRARNRRVEIMIPRDDR